jgi:DNA-directed RNA polymerase sigma subunit (sigma70/sigma32)
MIYINVEDFYEKTSKCIRLSRQEEIECAKQMKTGDASSRERLIESYLPMVVATVKHAPAHMQTLGLVFSCLSELEKAVDNFNFLQESETFSHRLSWHLRQATVKYLAESGE